MLMPSNMPSDSWRSLSVDQAGLICPLTGVWLITRLCAVLGHSMKRMPWPWRKVPLDSPLSLSLSAITPSQPVNNPLPSCDDISGSSTGQEGRAIARPVASWLKPSKSPSGRKVSGLSLLLSPSNSLWDGSFLPELGCQRSWLRVLCWVFAFVVVPPLAKNKLKPATKTNINLWHSLGTHLWICFEYCYNLLGQKDNINL